jgi:hypothetical protein
LELDRGSQLGYPEIRTGLLMASSKSTAIHRRWGAVAILAITSWLLRTHLSAQAIPEVAELAHFFASEQRFSVLTYSQTYMDDDHERVSYKGTPYNSIHSFGLKGCEVVADVAVEDRYSGAIQHKIGLGRVRYEQTGELTDDTVYEYRFSLTSLKANEIQDFRARPAEFSRDTNFQCQEDRLCELSWVRLTTRDTAINETRTVNGFQDLNRKVNVIALPTASAELAADVVKLFRGAVRACAGS